MIQLHIFKIPLYKTVFKTSGHLITANAYDPNDENIIMSGIISGKFNAVMRFS